MTAALSHSTSSSPPITRSSSPSVVGNHVRTAISSSPSASNSQSSPRCCDSGRIVFTDPLTGQPICSCQYDILNNYQRLAVSGATALPLSMYSTPYADGMAAYFPALGADQSPFYASAAGLDLKDNIAAGATWPYPAMYHPYDAAFAAYPFSGYGVDLNGARRKNATRETTSTLKAWLNEHKKNPYPTKGEKIMLAIITKMTLTQVSTWFANARRRLKKENKMTWEPRNRVEDDDNNDDASDGRKSVDNKDNIDSKDSGTASSEDGDRPMHHHRLDLLERPLGSGAVDTASEWSEPRADSERGSPEYLYDQRPQHLIHPAFHNHTRFQTSPTSNIHQSDSSNVTNKPRIWSLADMATKENDLRTSMSSSSVYSNGKILSSFPGRGPAPAPHPSNYARSHEFYRNFYGPHFANAATTNDILESYSRSIGANLSPGNINSTNSPFSSMAAVVAAAAAAASSNPSMPATSPGSPFTLSINAGASSASSIESTPSDATPVPSLHVSNSLLKSDAAQQV